MDDILAAYIPMDRRQAMAQEKSLPQQTTGAALFADISGFTALTTALAQELGPQRGAEEVLRHVNPVYEALIAELHQYRGAVIGFAGDSITCWFDEKPPTPIGSEQPAAERALTCALAMQRAMTPFAAIHTAGGTPLSIAVKIALAVGPARRFAVGDPNIQLIDALAGSTLDQMAAVERLTEKGEVAASAELVATVGKDRVAVADWRGDAPGARRAAIITAFNRPIDPDPWPSLPQTLPRQQVQPWLLPPVYERLQGGGFLAELRPAIALFLKFSGLDYDHDAAAGEKLDAYIRWAQSTLARYEGYLLQLTIGDKGSYLYAAFGAPLAHDDDAPRAVAAALDLRSPPAALDFITETQIGLSQGRMWTGACGAAARRTYGVMGAETNMAARLMSRAEPGQILVSQRLANAVGLNYYLNYLGLVPIKGQAEPLPISELLGRQAALPSQPSNRYAAPLVGREKPLALLDEALSLAAVGQGQIVRVEGVTGIGKSHLMAVFSRSAEERGWRAAVGHCLSINQSIAYMPWRQIFYGLLDLTQEVAANPPPEQLAERVEAAVRRMNPDWLLRLPLLGDLLGLPIPDNSAMSALDGRLRQESLLALATAMLKWQASQQPLLLLLEDVHWLDDASLTLAAAVGRSLEDDPILLTLAQRPVSETDQPLLPALNDLPYCRQITLKELPPDSIAAMIDNRLGGPVSPAAVSLIGAKAAGNPFFVEELVDSLQEAGDLRQTTGNRWTLSDAMHNALYQAGCLTQKGDEWQLVEDAPLMTVDLGVPDSVQGIVLSRMDRLLESHKLLLKVASVIGQRFELDLVRQAHPPAAPTPEMIANQIREIETRDFVHLEQNGQAVPVYAFRHSATQEVAYATLLFEQRRQLHQTVCKLLEQSQPDNVSTLAHHAFQGEDWPRARRYYSLAGRQARKVFANKTAVAHLRRAQAAAARLPAGDLPAGRLEIIILLGEILVQLGRYEEATAELEEGLSLAESIDDNAGYVELCRWLARRWELAGEFDEAQRWIEQGLSRLAGKRTPAAAELVATASFILSRRGRQKEAQQLAEEALAIGENLADNNLIGQARNLLGRLARLRGENEKALHHFQTGLSLYEEAGNVYGMALTHNHIANACFALGRWTKAGEHYETAQRTFARIGALYDQAMAENNLGQLALYRGRLELALSLYRSALAAFQQTGKSLYVLGVVEMNIGATYVRLGDVAAAQRRLETAADYFARVGARDFLPELHRHMALMYMNGGRLDTALQEGETSLALARELNMTTDEGIALRIIGQIQQARGELTPAQTALTESVAILTSTGDRYETAQAQLVLSELYARIGSDEAAADLQAAGQTLLAELDITQETIRAAARRQINENP